MPVNMTRLSVISWRLSSGSQYVDLPVQKPRTRIISHESDRYIVISDPGIDSISPDGRQKDVIVAFSTPNDWKGMLKTNQSKNVQNYYIIMKTYSLKMERILVKMERILVKMERIPVKMERILMKMERILVKMGRMLMHMYIKMINDKRGTANSQYLHASRVRRFQWIHR